MWKLIKDAVRVCVMGKHELCQKRMSELSSVIGGRSTSGSPSEPGKTLPALLEEVRVGMFNHPTAPAFHRLRAIFKSGRCNPVSGSWESGGAVASSEVLGELLVAAEQQLQDPRWVAERGELEQMRTAMGPPCVAGSTR